MKGSFGDGAGYFVRGLKLLKHPSLRPFVIIPLLINIVIFGSLIWLTVSYVESLVGSMLAAVPDWLSWLTWLIWPLVGVTLALITGYLFTAVAILIASPFNALLAEKAEELITGEPVDSLEGIGAAIADLPLLLLVLILSWIPPFNAVAPLLWFLFGAWMMAVQYVDYPMDNHMTPFADLKEVLRERRLSSLGFGGVVALVSGVPVLNFFVVPASVCGATLFWCEELATEHRRIVGSSE